MSTEKARHHHENESHVANTGGLSTASSARSVSEMVLIEEGTTLSSSQQQTSQELMRLYEKLCGGQPGLCWPQALLDSAGGFSRPPFPTRAK